VAGDPVAALGRYRDTAEDIAATDDHMGMLGTIINALALATSLRKMNIDTVVLSAISMTEICESFSQRATLYHLSMGRVVIF
ncbi:hypothetical protein AB9E28_35365, partial [Rhizobium leguminosarum]